MSVTGSDRQGGAALVVSLIMLTLITLLVIAALGLGTSNFRAVSNMQFREQAIAAANVAIQERVSSTFNEPPAVTHPTVDLNSDGVTDYAVTITPTCINASIAESADPSSVSLPGSMSMAATWNTVWDIQADVSEPDSGASVIVHAGVRVLLSQSNKDAACP